MVSNLSADIAVLNFYADGHNILTVDVEANPAEPYVLADILSANGKSVTGCRDYDFIGWKTGGPIVGDENPTSSMVTEVSPIANMNLYAVYEKPGVLDDTYVRITSAKDLHAGDQYILACYYEWDGDVYYGPSYWALGSSQDHNSVIENYGDEATVEGHSVNLYVYGRCYVSATQIFPSAGTVVNPDNTIVWTLGGAEDAWTFTNAGDGNKQLNIRRNVYQFVYQKDWGPNQGVYIHSTPNAQLLTNPGNTFSIAAANGAFNFRADNGYYLTYSEDDDDYFQTGTSNSWKFYLYKKSSVYTSFPNCEDWTLHLNAADGFVGNTGKHEVDMKEDNPGDGFELPVATRPAGNCNDWTFAGWIAETPINGQRSPQYGKSNAPELISAGTTYHPRYNGETLYAVFQKTETGVTYYERISSTSELVNGETYVIATTSNRAVASSKYSTAAFNYEMISVVGSEISSNVGANIQWTCEYSNSKYKFKKGTTYLSYNGNNYWHYYVENGTSPFRFREDYSGTLYLALLTDGTNNFFGEYEGDYDEFYIYRRKTHSVTTYTSFPHCTPYTIILHTCGGSMSGVDDNEKVEWTENLSEGIGFTLPSVTPRCPDEGWVFEGWLEGGDLASVEEVEFTGLNTGHYVPLKDSIHLYAVYKRKTNKFRIMYHPTYMVEGDNYIITGYPNLYDYAISSTKYSDNYLSYVIAPSPQEAEGYYVTMDDENAIWIMHGAYNNCTFQNLADNSLYLRSDNNGYTTTGATGTSYAFTYHSSSNGFLFDMKDRVNSKYMTFNTTNKYFYTAGSYSTNIYVYRQMKEYTSWPHCDPFVVNFDGCGGTAGVASLEEPVFYAGVTLPNAYANSDCSKEGWTFAGWSTEPITSESDVLTVDLLPAGTHYRLRSNNSTLYAVYCAKEETYKRISSLEELAMGINYVVMNGNDTKAMGNTLYDSNKEIEAVGGVSRSGNVVTNTNPALDWRLEGRAGKCVFYNQANDVYLDLQTIGGELLTAAAARDSFVITYENGFVARSIMSLEPHNKYLGCQVDSFKIVSDAANERLLHLYQQEAVYHSYPSCISDVDVIKWEKATDGNYVTVESYLLSGEPAMDGATGHPTDQATDKSGTAQDGTWEIKYTTASLAPCTMTIVAWGDKTADIRIPYIVDANTNSSTLLGETDCRTCDLVVMSGKTFTVNNNKRLHMVTVQEGATLNIADGATLTVNSLVLGANSDQTAPIVTLNNSGAIKLKNGELYYDLRIPEDRFYWISLPFASQTQEISYSNVAANGGMPVYNEDFFVYYYDGASRAADANAGHVQDTYWKVVADDGVDYTMQAGHGHLFGILDQKDIVQKDGRKHTKRVMRFTMRPPVATWLTQEHTGGSKTTTVVPSACTDTLLAFHAGWNLVGNPYMHTYNTGTVSGEGGLSNGAWKKDMKNAVWTGSWILDDGRPAKVPYITVFNPAATDEYPYSQSLASNFDLRPFQAVFIQVNEGNSLNFLNNMAVPKNAPAYQRFIQQEGPVRTGVTLTGAGRTDRTGVVLSDEYTTRYEIGADLQKMLNGGLNLYTLNSDNQQLAFNGLSEEDAVAPIPVGVTIPATGEYTFAFDAEQYSLNELDTLMLIDYTENTQTDLRYRNYTFTAQKGANEGRFALLIRLAKTPQIVTNLDETYDADKPRKIIRDGILYIIRDDKMYNALGAEVR